MEMQAQFNVLLGLKRKRKISKDLKDEFLLVDKTARTSLALG